MWFEPLLDELRRAPSPVLEVGPDIGRPDRVALLPGSFDPVTVAHAALAEASARYARLTVLVYAVRTLPKEGEPPPALLSEAERVAGLVELCSAHPNLVVGLCSHGLLADQVEAARVRFPEARLWLAMGSDKVLQLFDPKWYEDRDRALDRLFAHAEVLYAVRAGDEGRVEEALDAPENLRWKGRITRVPVPADVAAVSSRLVRERLLSGEDVTSLIPPEVKPVIAPYLRAARLP